MKRIINYFRKEKSVEATPNKTTTSKTRLSDKELLKMLEKESKENRFGIGKSEALMNMRKGFTLVELMIVLSVIAIIAGIGAYNISKDNSKEHFTAKSEIRAVKKDLAAYFKEHRTYEGFTTSLDVQIPVLEWKNFCLQKTTSDGITYRYSQINDYEIVKSDCVYADASNGHRTYDRYDYTNEIVAQRDNRKTNGNSTKIHVGH